eukprot:bmy_15280T0
MVCYSLDPENPTKSCELRGSNLRVHFKNTRETAQVIKGMHIQKATKYLKDVTLKKQCVPFRRYNGGVESNDELKGLDVDSLVIEHIQVNKAPKMRHRTYRAHGRINPYMSSPCHIEMILTEKEQIVPKPEEEWHNVDLRERNCSQLYSNEAIQRKRLGKLLNGTRQGATTLKCDGVGKLIDLRQWKRITIHT